MKIFGIQLGKSKQQTISTTTKNGERARMSNVVRKQQKRNVSYEIKDINLAIDLARNVDYPDRSRLFKIYDYIIRDGHTKSQIRTALIKLQAEPFALYKNGKSDIAKTEELRKKWFNAIIRYIFESELYGFSLVECWEIDAKGSNIKEVISFERDHVSIEKEWILIDGSINGDFIDYGALKNELDLIQFGNKQDLGILLECAYNVIWKYYSRSDWSRGNEKVGVPMLSIEADTNNETELDKLEDRAANFGSDGYIVSQKGDKATLIERKSDNFHVTFKDNIALCNDEISKCINGQTGATEAQPYVGSAQVMERTMDDFTMSRLQNIVDEMKENVFPYLISKGFSLDGYTFDYPRLVRERERRFNGLPTPTDPTQQLDTPPATK